MEHVHSHALMKLSQIYANTQTCTHSHTHVHMHIRGTFDLFVSGTITLHVFLLAFVLLRHVWEFRPSLLLLLVWAHPAANIGIHGCSKGVWHDNKHGIVVEIIY